jgi:Ca-activated chloride channel family protein
LLNRDEARKIYEEIVRRQKDPSLLEFVERDMFKASVYPVPAQGNRLVSLSYDSVLEATGDSYKYVYPLPAASAQAPSVVNVRIKSSRPIKNIYSPSHPISVHRDGELSASVGFEVSGSAPRSDFSLFYSVSEDSIGMNLLTHKDTADGGFFMLMASPRVDFPEDDIAPSDIAFVIDRTGSMRGEKIEQAREALKFCLRGLRPSDRFNVILFNERAEPLFDSLQTAEPSRVDRALSVADSIMALGGTNIDAALESAFSLKFDPDRPAYVIFLTDGLPTVGVTDVASILRNAASRAPKNIRLFVFGVGFDVNTLLLDKLAAENRGAAEYVRPEEDIEVKVSALYRMISAPALTDVRLDFGKMNVSDVLPAALPDIFLGSHLMVAGRFTGVPGPVRLTGMASGVKKEFLLNAPSTVGNNPFIPQLWAARRIGSLIEEIRRGGGDKRELITEVVFLSKKYGIITEYTSYLVEEPSIRLSSEPSGGYREMMLAESKTTEAADAVSGAWGVNQSITASNLARAAAPVPAAEQGFRDKNDNVVNITNVRSVNGRAFYLDAGTWNDSRYNNNFSDIAHIKPYSEAQFAILKEIPELSQYFALGENVTIVIGDMALRVAPDGGETISDKQLQAIIARRDKL